MTPPEVTTPPSRPAWSRRQFVAATGGAAIVGRLAQSQARAEQAGPGASGTGASSLDVIDFPSSYLTCAPTGTGISVRVQMECRGCLTDAATGATDEYVLGVMAKTGLTSLPEGGGTAPGYDYAIIFSKSHVFTKRSHSSAYLNNPTILEHQQFGDAGWRLQRAAAEPLKTAADVRRAISQWRRITARTVFTSADGARRFAVEYPVKWADYSLSDDHLGDAGFRVETGPVFLLDPDHLRVGSVPGFDDVQWAHFDYHGFDSVRSLLERPTPILADAAFAPPSEHGRDNRATATLSEAQVQKIRDALHAGADLSDELLERLLSTDHYSQARESHVLHELYALAD